ncbi:MAG TPA: choice-of-anchor tandem repeat GloVer-containing protein [Chthonomonadaceae bacterium]|nr:choice-of-anchor tandem repeat GloVer-containing protein [Chthonomonadaceae bacterium]
MRTLLRGGSRLMLAACLFLSCLFAAAAQSPALVTLYAFSSDATGVNSDGAYPRGGLILASDGAFYGTATNGGAHGNGTIFKITPDGAWTTLYSFSNAFGLPETNADGSHPYDNLLEGSDGNFYGTTRDGGANGYGVVFQISPQGAFTTLHAFQAADGANPYAALVAGPDGDFYGTTTYLGGNDSGTVFKISPSGDFTVLYNFTYFGFTDGADPEAALLLGSDGAFYGTTFAGGHAEYGAIFRITTDGQETLLYSFHDPDGLYPRAPLIEGPNGVLYGSAFVGSPVGVGTVFKIEPNGHLVGLHRFEGPEGAYPNALIQGSDGNLYGTTYAGGQYGYGTIFELTVHRGYTTLHSFTGADGAYPRAGLIEGPGGNLYGTTFGGGTNGDGTLFCLQTGRPVPVLSRITPNGVATDSRRITLTALGSGFSPDSAVRWTSGTTSLTLDTTYVSATELQAVVPGPLLETSGKAEITVFTPPLGGGVSNPRTFRIR